MSSENVNFVNLDDAMYCLCGIEADAASFVSALLTLDDSDRRELADIIFAERFGES